MSRDVERSRAACLPASPAPSRRTVLARSGAAQRSVKDAAVRAG
ncbi:hypothetical protein F750_2097 [Streptomyces sp. PAMC 26508]|nr:hypothetical protein F750_2097 [Streptomyces sp. PAMC 26508]